MQLYREQPGVFSHLSRRAQSDLHTYFQTTNLGTDIELLAEKARLAAQDKSLPQRAGRALKDLTALQTRDLLPRARMPAINGVRNVRIRAVMRADPDAVQVARAFIQMAEAKAAEGQQRHDNSA